MTGAATVTISAPAKINLGLDILRRRDDGFHDLETVFVAVSLADELKVTAEGAAEDTLEVSGRYSEGVPTDDRNLVLRAISVFRGAGPAVPALRVHLVKNIPHGAGLGGGSSDAAAMLRALAMMFPGARGTHSLHDMACALGSDCPFFLGGGAAQATGRGEHLRPICGTRGFGLLLVIPEFPVSTREAFGVLKPSHLGSRTRFDDVVRALGDDAVAMPRLFNTFEEGLAVSHPRLSEIRAELLRCGASQALLSGSGSATFGIFESFEAAEGAALKWRGMEGAIAVRPVAMG